MAHYKFALVVLLLIAVVGMAFGNAVDAPAGNSVVGTLDGGATTTAAPVGGPIPSSVYESLSPAEAPHSAAVTTAGVSVTTTLAAVTLAFSLFF